MSDFGFPTQASLFSRTLRECRELYVSSGQLVEREHRDLLGAEATGYASLMDDLHKGLVLKVYVAVCEADKAWSKQEQLLAEVLCHHLWGQWIDGAPLRETMKQMADDSAKIAWYSVLKPFERMPPLRERVAELETLVVRLANLVARADGDLKPEESTAITFIQQQLHDHLLQIAVDDEPAAGPKHEPAVRPPASSTAQASKPAVGVPATQEATKPSSAQPAAADAPPKTTIAQALSELDALIGLESVKHEVRSLANYLKLEQRRLAAGLPATEISLHMVFTGNPGTGKTTVARILGKVFAALGVLEKGHLIETDRSGLVAEYAGQTGPKTNKKIDDALGGLLFIDEAYSLVAEGGEDPYGREATQALLKRAEDDRSRLVVILAGYPEEMYALLKSNPGLSSRFNRQLAFDDYTPLELCRIFGMLCAKSHYELTPGARLKVMLGLRWQYEYRDQHFGNGRAVRNLFEQAVRRLANRLAEVVAVEHKALVTLRSADIEFEEVPAAAFEGYDESRSCVRLVCAGCQHSKVVPPSILGRKVTCPKCESNFVAEWGEIADDDPASLSKSGGAGQSQSVHPPKARA